MAEATTTEQNTQPGVSQVIQSVIENTVPYSRFKEVNAERAELASKVQQYEQSLAQQSQPQPQANGQPMPSTVDELINHVMSQVDNKLNTAYQEKLAPIEQRLQTERFSSAVENYFSTPEKAALRTEMDAYTLTMTPQEQSFIKERITAGDTKWLDNIYYAVASQRQANAQQQAAAQANKSAFRATTPTPYKSVNTVPLSRQDYINQAKQTGDWSSMFAQMIPPAQ